MKNLLTSLLITLSLYTSFSQRITDTDGDWSKQFVVLKNTREADLMIRVGDIDNLGFGFDPGYNPFSGRSSTVHPFPWKINSDDARGTDRIMIPSGYKYGSLMG